MRALAGPLLVLAGAGTGKTRVVTYRIAELIRHGTPPARILGVTFTNKAAAEMQQRIQTLLRGSVSARPIIGTFHAYCVRILRRHARRLGYPDSFTIYDQGDQESLARGVLRELGGPGALSLRDLLQCIGRWKTHAVRPPEAEKLAQTDDEHWAAVGYRRYQQGLRCAGAFDFDDLLLCTEELLTGHAAVLREEAARFDHLLVDEYQDTNATQYLIVKALASPHRNLCVVGDDDQSIYGWRGAQVEHILSFRRDWPDAKVIRLEENYRSTAEILTLANNLIAFNKTRHTKVLRAARSGGQKPRIEQFPHETAEADGVAADIDLWLRRGGWEPRDFAILCRTNEQPRAFEVALRQAKLPYVLIGTSSFYDRKEVRDVLAYLRVLASSRDESSLLRIINNPPRGIGPATIEHLLQEAVQSGRSVWEVVSQPQHRHALPPRVDKAVRDFAEFIHRFRHRAQSMPLAECTRQLLGAIDYQGELNRIYAEPVERDARWRDVEELVNALAAYQDQHPGASLRGFLDDVMLSGQDFDDEKEKQLQRNAVALITLHSAKGLEFPHVYLVGMEEGLLPHRHSLEVEGTAIDEERRLCYVGVTRAQERLTLTLALTRRKWGKPRDSIPSRFLYEMIGRTGRPAAKKTAARAPHAAPSKRARKRQPRSG